ncbi:MAG: response regulator [Deltaproteobacteria bacterium]|nr:response regulator [Deltaproteobacteria bacterium]NIS77218.1 response regulator [Deltaproteobacteria bacterium]
MLADIDQKGRILVVDDEPDVLESLSSILTIHGFSVEASLDGYDAMEKLTMNNIEAVITDINMPGISGLDLLDMIHEYNPELPVLLITGYADLDNAITAIKRKAFDFIQKPYKPEDLIDALEKALKYHRNVESEKRYRGELEETVRERTRRLTEVLTTLKNASREMVQTLASIAEYRDTYTGDHIRRIGLYSRRIAEALGMPEEFVETITFASTLHDIGKVGIPDDILLKPGPLTPGEFGIIQSHTTIGAKMLSQATYPGIDLAASIALNHHERWDGSGYPRKLKGEKIPSGSRIVMLADQYDALRSRRPYKEPFDHDTAFKMIVEGNSRSIPEHFDPDVLTAFEKVSRDFEIIFETHQSSIVQ